MKQNSFARIVSCLLAVFMVLSMTAIMPAVAADETLLSENFQVDDSELNRNIVGWNGWEGGYASGSSTVNVQDSNYTLVSEYEGSENKVLKIYRPTSNSASLNYNADKMLSKTVNEGIVHYSMRLSKKTATTSMFKLCLYDSTGKVQEITIDMYRNQVVCGSTVFPLSEATQVDVWYTFNIYIDIKNKKFKMYQDDSLLASDVVMGSTNGSIRGISLSTNRTAATSAGSNAIFYVDDVSVTILPTINVAETLPEDGVINAEISDKIELLFTQTVDETSLATQNVTVSGAEVSSVDIDAFDDKKVIVTLTAPLNFETEYTVLVSSIKDIYGQTMPEYSFSFTTRPSIATYSEPKFYLDYEGAKTDITSSGLTEGIVTAEIGVINETDESSDAVLVLKTVRNGKCVNVASEPFTLPLADSEEKKVRISAEVVSGDVLELLVIDDWETLLAETDTYTFADNGVTKNLIGTATKADSVLATMDYDFNKVHIKGNASIENAIVVVAVLNDGYSADEVTKENTNLAVHSIQTAMADENAIYDAAIDSTAFEYNVDYTIIAGGKSTSLVIRDRAVTQAALTLVKNSTAEELADLIEGNKAVQDGVYLNDILQLDLKQYLILSNPEAVLEKLAGKSFANTEELQIAYSVAIEQQSTYEENARNNIGKINAASWNELENALKDAGDIISVEWNGDYKKLSVGKRDLLFKILANNYTFASADDIEKAFSKEVSNLLEITDEEGETKTVIKEEFNVANNEIGCEALGWNGWSGGYDTGSGSVNVKDSIYTIEQDPQDSSNKVLQLYRPTSNSNSLRYVLTKDLPEIISGGVVQIGFKIKSLSAVSSYFQLGLYDHVGTLWDNQILMSTSRISCSGETVNFAGNTGSNPGAPLDEWHEFTFYFNLDDKVVSIYQGDKLLKSGIAFPTNFKNSIKTIAINTHRTATGNGAKFLVDDIVVEQTGAMFVSNTNPQDGAKNVDVAFKPAIIFSRPVDAQSVSKDTIVVENAEITSVSVDPTDSSRVVIEFADKLNFNTTYNVRVSGVKDTCGQATKNANFSFTTRAGKVMVSDVDYYLDYEGTKKDITDSGLEEGYVTAELDITNETTQTQNVWLVLQSARRGKTYDIAAKKYSVNGNVDNTTITVYAQSGQELRLMVIDEWNSLITKDAMYSFNAYGVHENELSVSSAAKKVNTSVNSETGKLEITGTAETAGATVTAVVLKPGYLPGDITEANVSEAVYGIEQMVSDVNAEFNAMIDASEMTENAAYTVVAGGKKTTVIKNDATKIQSALDTVKTSSAQVLGALITGQSTWQYGLSLNDVLQLDISDYILLENKTSVLNALAGKTFADLNALRAQYYTALKQQIDYENRCNTAIKKINASGWEKLEELLKEYDDVLIINWSGSYSELSDDNKVSLYKILAKDYTFKSVAEIKEGFDEEADNQLEIQEDDDKKDGGYGGGSGGGGGGGSSMVTRQPGAAIEFPELITNEKTEENKIKFTDLQTVPWAVESIEALSEKGIINGTGYGIFAPNDFITREQFVKIVVLAFDLKGETSVEFKDVNSDMWYAPYIAIAVENGIIQGVGNNMFGVGNHISRSDIAVILNRIAQKQGAILPDVDTADFRDAVLIPEYAQKSAAVMQKLEIMVGDENKCFSPYANATRAMAAKVVYMLMSIVNTK